MRWLGGAGLWYQQDGSQLWIGWADDTSPQYVVRQRIGKGKIVRVAGPYASLDVAKVALITLRSLT